MKQLIKKFFKPSWRKILLFLIFMVISLPLSFCFYSLFSQTEPLLIGDCGTTFIGFPMPFLEYDSCSSYFGEPLYKSITFVGSSNELIFALQLLTIDLIFWYLISCLVILIFSKLKSRSKIKKSLSA